MSALRSALINAYRQACEDELQAFKPGNVSIYSEGHDMTVEQFRLSASVSVIPLTDPSYSLGEKIYYAVKMTRDAVGCNTNLGILLLSAPLIEAVYGRRSGQTLREALGNVLNRTSVEDAEWVFRAISLASPGGLGETIEQDVRARAEVTLQQAMALAADRDRIAKQYINSFKDIFDFTVLTYNRAFVLSGDRGWATLKVFAEMLARYPDSHIERKYGKQYSEWIATEMRLLSEHMTLFDGFAHLLPSLYKLDEELKCKNINPGTTADFTVTTVLVVLLEQLIASGIGE
ncbi:MAG: hypothetical protein RLZ92_886 [Pseudomonadota bacterium]|jgi:triphosphoribosyl-dephospho-CoA synthase